MRELVAVEVVFLVRAACSRSSTSCCSPSAALVAKLVAARGAVCEEGPALLLFPGGLAAGLVGEALREGPPGRLELAAVRAPRGLFEIF